MSFALASLAVCLALYAAVARYTRQDFVVSFKLARGIVSVALTAIGFFALVHWWALAPAGYMGRHEADAIAAALVQLIFGHFLADFVLLGWSYWRHGARPRPDLVLHHGLGLFAVWVVQHYAIGHALFLVLFTTEMMPVTTGLAAWAALRQDAALELRAQQLRLAVLVLWRMPLWFVIGALMIYNLFVLTPDAWLAIGYRFSLAFLVVTLSLDSYWIHQCIRGLRRWRTASARA